MPRGWGAGREAAEKAGGGKFVKLENGKSIEGVFRGDPYTFFSIYGDKERREFDDQVPNSQFKFKINLVVKENGAYVAKVFGSGWTTFNSLDTMIQELGQDQLFKLICSKSGNKTSYNIVPKGPITQAEKQNIAAVKLHKLSDNKVDSALDFPGSGGVGTPGIDDPDDVPLGDDDSNY